MIVEKPSLIFYDKTSVFDNTAFDGVLTFFADSLKSLSTDIRYIEMYEKH